MENLKIQENLIENIKKVLEKLREEGLKGNKEDDNSYPVEVENTINLINNYDTVISSYKDKPSIKDYNDYMKLIQVLEELFQMYTYHVVCDKELNSYIKNKISEEIGYIQNTANQSLNNNYIKQYSCLIKCYKLLLRNFRCIN